MPLSLPSPAPSALTCFQITTSAMLRRVEVAKWVRRNERSGTDSEPVVKEASNYIVRRHRNCAGAEFGPDSGGLS